MKTPHKTLLLFLLLLFSCSQLPTESRHDQQSYSYTLKLTGLHQDSLSISLKVSRPGKLALPYHFFDNPVDYVSGIIVRDLQVIDSDGLIIDTTCTLEKIGPVYNIVLDLTYNIHYPVTLNYKLNNSAFEDTSKDYLPSVQVSDSLLFLIGASCFIIPYLDLPIANAWRTPLDLRVNVESRIPIYGIPGKSFSCSNLYELLFIQFSAGCSPIVEGTSGETKFTFVDMLNGNYETAVMPTVAQNFSRILDTISSLYGKFPSLYTVALQDFGGGLEGSYGFSLLQPNLALESRFHEVLAHEALHHFIGIQCGEYDDPWWKEATTNYLGAVLVTAMNLYSKAELRKRFTSFFYVDPSVSHLALSEPWLRENMFAQKIHSLAYDKGTQVVMLLDLKVRQASDNKYSINDVTAYLTRKFSKSAFHRQDFISAFKHFGNPDISDVIATYIDTPGTTIPDSVLVRTFDELDSLGAFGD